MMHSFKFKIALLSFVLSGTLLTGFGLFFFAFAYNTGIERMDSEIRTLAESSLRGGRSPGYWENFERSLQFIYGERSPARIALYVIDRDQRTPFISDNAPAELAALVSKQAAEPSHARESMPSPIERLDTDGDGYISVPEFDGPLRDFKKVDANDDGKLSAQEADELSHRPKRPRMHPEPQEKVAPVFQNLETAESNWRVGIFQSPGLTLTIAMDMDVFYADIKQFQTAFTIAVPTGLVLLALAGWLLAARAMRPVAAIADTAASITAKELDRRIPQVGSDVELERLVSVSNNMLERLEKSYRQAVRFSADAAHELQTPLTILQGELDNAIQASETGSAEQQRYSMLLEELRNLKAVVRKLLLLAHADEGRLKLNRQAVDLSELLHAALEDLEIMAPELHLDCSIANGQMISADPALLTQALRNLTSNAAKYTTTGGSVSLSLRTTDEHIKVTLSNTAADIPQDDQAQIFERFHRVEKSRTTTGSGLGLSLAREIARAHGGDLVLNPYMSGMVSFTLSLPRTECHT